MLIWTTLHVFMQTCLTRLFICLSNQQPRPQVCLIFASLIVFHVIEVKKALIFILGRVHLWFFAIINLSVGLLQVESPFDLILCILWIILMICDTLNVWISEGFLITFEDYELFSKRIKKSMMICFIILYILLDKNWNCIRLLFLQSLIKLVHF